MSQRNSFFNIFSRIKEDKLENVVKIYRDLKK